MRIAFQNWLWLLAAVPVAAAALWLAFTSAVSLPPWRFRASLAARLALLLAVVLALAGLTVIRTRDRLGVFFVLDVSRSVSGEDQKFAAEWIAEALREVDPRRDRAGLVVFGGTAAIEHPLEAAFDPTRMASIVHREATDIAQAVRLAAASFPPDMLKRIVLITDGEENRGAAVEAGREARTAGIDFRLHRLPGRKGRDVALEKIDIPGEAKVDEAFDLHVHTRFAGAKPGEAARGTLRLWRNRRLLGSYEVEVGPGEDVFRIPQKITREEGAGGYEYEAVLEIDPDTFGDNNRVFGYTRIVGEARVLLVEGRPGASEALEKALRDGGVSNLERRPPEMFPVTMSELLNYDAVLLDDVPAAQLSTGDRGQLQLLKDYVESHGGGLAMIGGDRSFGVGGYYRTPVEEALPVEMDVRKRKMRASMALVIAIDQSGSMSMTVPGGQTKLSLANESAVQVVEMLDSRSQLGVVYVDTAPKWAVLMRRVDDAARAGIIGDIRSNRGGGGGIYVYTALREAYGALEKVDAAIRHVILFSDASDSEQREGCIEKATAERRRGRTLTVIGMGKETDQHGEFLRDLAAAGDGRIVFVDDLTQLPRIFTDETVIASKSSIVEVDFVPKPAAASTLTEGIDWASAPPLHGYMATMLKPRGEMVLQATEEDPLVAKWQFGLGRSAAFTSDAGARWAREWLTWDGYRRFWPQMARWISRRRSETDYQATVRIDGGVGKVALDAFDANGEPRNFLALTARVSGPAGKPVTVPLTQRGSGRYEGTFPADDPGGYFVTITDTSDTIVGQAGGAVSYPAEYRASEAAPTLLGDLLRAAGGREALRPQGLFEHTGRPAESPTEVWPSLLWLALVLLLVDVAIRRIAIGETAAYLLNLLLKRKPRAVPVPVPVIEGLERLKSAKRAAAPRVLEPPPLPEAPAAAESPIPDPAKPPAPAPAPAAEEAYMRRLLDAKKKAKKS